MNPDLSKQAILYLQRGSRDSTSSLIQINSITRFSELLHHLASEKSQLSPYVYKTIVFLYMENHENVTFRELITSSLIDLLRTSCRKAPLAILLDPLIRQIKTAYTKSFILNTFDFQLLYFLADHPYLNPSQAISFLDLLSKIYCELIIYSSSFINLENLIQIMDLLLSRFLEDHAFLEYCQRLSSILLSMYFESARKKPMALNTKNLEEMDDEHIIYTQKRAMIIELLKKLVGKYSFDLNTYLKPGLIKTYVSLTSQTKTENRGLISVISLFGNPNEIIQDMKNEENEFKKQKDFLGINDLNSMKGFDKMFLESDLIEKKIIPALQFQKSPKSVYQFRQNIQENKLNIIHESSRNESLESNEFFDSSERINSQSDNIAIQDVEITRKSTDSNKFKKKTMNYSEYEKLISEETKKKDGRTNKFYSPQILKDTLKRHSAKTSKVESIASTNKITWTRKMEDPLVTLNLEIARLKFEKNKLMKDSRMVKPKTLPKLSNKLYYLQDESSFLSDQEKPFVINFIPSSEFEERDHHSIKTCFKMYKKALEIFFLRYAKPVKELEGQRALSAIELLKMLKDMQLSFTVNKETAIYILKKFLRFMKFDDLRFIKWREFKMLMVQLSIYIFTHFPYKDSQSPYGIMLERFLSTNGIIELNIETPRTIELNKIFAFNSEKLELPLNYKVVDKPNYILYRGFHSSLENQLSNKFKICYEIVSDLLRNVLDIDILEVIFHPSSTKKIEKTKETLNVLPTTKKDVQILNQRLKLEAEEKELELITEKQKANKRLKYLQKRKEELESARAVREKQEKDRKIFEEQERLSKEKLEKEELEKRLNSQRKRREEIRLFKEKKQIEKAQQDSQKLQQDQLTFESKSKHRASFLKKKRKEMVH